ncbi:hypothetical protein MSAN_02504200 [Mycena sanguinolenta]|uniref:Uncharacterized protein n=1 Tax=Mycena sanguinolenta TaxID=230812 RepID=A0A8H6U1G6_9AGAR|nr:hypothetical protein MSAN_02504200 [Mycena sanguinolenta]
MFTDVFSNLRIFDIIILRQPRCRYLASFAAHVAFVIHFITHNFNSVLDNDKPLLLAHSIFEILPPPNLPQCHASAGFRIAPFTPATCLILWSNLGVLQFGHTHPYQLSPQSPPHPAPRVRPNSFFILNLVMLNILFILSPVMLVGGHDTSHSPTQYCIHCTRALT